MAIFLFLSQKNQENQQFYLNITIWLLIISSCIFSSSDFLKNDFQNGVIEQAILAIENFENFIFAKITANWLIFCLPIIILTAFIINHKNNPEMIKILILATIIINSICCFSEVYHH